MIAILFQGLSQRITYDFIEILTADWLVAVLAKAAVWDCYNVISIQIHYGNKCAEVMQKCLAVIFFFFTIWAIPSSLHNGTANMVLLLMLKVQTHIFHCFQSEFISLYSKTLQQEIMRHLSPLSGMINSFWYQNLQGTWQSEGKIKYIKNLQRSTSFI